MEEVVREVVLVVVDENGDYMGVDNSCWSSFFTVSDLGAVFDAFVKK